MLSASVAPSTAPPQGEANGGARIDVGIVGTFDIENYGDLLFPLIAQAALARREPRIRVLPFSVNHRSEPSWPFQVHSTADMLESVSSLSAMLIGGGQIVRFDKGYPVHVASEIDLPIAYWLVPAVLAATMGRPVIWNAVGAWADSPPAPWYDDLVRTVFSASYSIGVRDAASLEHLARLAPRADMRFLPDTAFGLSRLWPLEQESEGYRRWRQSLGIEGGYVVIQANHAISRYRSTIESVLKSDSMGRRRAVVLPICRCHGDRTEGFPAMQADLVPEPAWLAPQLITEIIRRSELVIASSLHACIAALSYGVPVARAPVSVPPSDRKFELLQGFEGVASIEEPEALRRVAQRGRTIERQVLEHADRLDRHWDEIAQVAVEPNPRHRDRSMALMLGWTTRACGDIERMANRRRGSLVARIAGAFRHRWLER